MRRRGRASGMSLLEVMIASVIIMIVTLAILPMFTRSMQNTTAGREMSQAANHGRVDAELVTQQPLDRLTFEVLPGTTQLQTQSRWVVTPGLPMGGGRWAATAGTGERTIWDLTRTVRLFNVSRIIPGSLENTDALDGATPDEFVHLRESVTEIVNTRSALNPMGSGLANPRSVEITTVRSF